MSTAGPSTYRRDGNWRDTPATQRRVCTTPAEVALPLARLKRMPVSTWRLVIYLLWLL